MGLWVSYPGYDASTEGAKFILSSDLDYLKIHVQGKLRINGTNNGDGTYIYNETDVPFPDLGYIPLTYVSFRWSNTAELYYPGFTSVSNPTYDGNPVPYAVESNKLILIYGNSAWSMANMPWIEAYYMVFKNRAV